MSRWPVRALTAEDASGAIALYAQFSQDIPVGTPGDFARVLRHPGTRVFGAFDRGFGGGFGGAGLRGMCSLHILPNMTYGARPYGLIENVITDAAVRGQGAGRAVMEHAIQMAWAGGAYKIMLLTGRARGASGFYERLGFSADEKFGMILRAPERGKSDSPVT